MTRPFIIGVGGSHSGTGKTTIASILLTAIRSSRLPVLRSRKRWGAVKYTKTDFYSSLIEDRTILGREDKDTAKLLDAGADEVLWIQAPPGELDEMVSAAIGRLSHLDGIIIEGNSAIEFSSPDIVIFKLGTDGEIVKASALRLIKKADIIVFPKSSMPGMDSGDTLLNTHQLSEVSPKFMRVVHFDPEDETSRQELLTSMDAVIEELILNRIKQALRQKAVDDRISCSAARQISEELRAPFGAVGKAANDLKIKIVNCELGCF
jgi:molybdopterin-guanine dinucleotide biosynthesis protein